MANKKRKIEKIYINDKEYNVRISPSGNRYVQGSFGCDTSGRRIRKKFTAATLKDLEFAIRRFLEDLDGRTGTNITYYNAFKLYIDTRINLEVSSKINYNTILNTRFKCLHKKPIIAITRMDLFNAINEEIKTSNPAQKTLVNATCYLCTVLEEFEAPVMTRKTRKDIMVYARNATKMNKGHNNDWDNLPTAIEIAKWAGANQRRHAQSTAIAVLLDLHSLRTEETRGLKYKDVYEDNGNCYVDIYATRVFINNKDYVKNSTKTVESTRKILIDQRLYELIHAQPHVSEEEFVITEKYPTYKNRIVSLMKEHGYDFITPHKLRHIFASDNKDNTIAKSVGGWSSNGGIAETVYTHVRQNERDELMRKYSKVLLDAYEESLSSITVDSLVDK